MSGGFQLTSSNLRHQTRLACGLIPLLNLLIDQGVDVDATLRPAGIRRIELFDPAFTISLEQELKIVEAALALIDEPGASLRLAQRYHLHNFSVLGLAIRACSTLGDVFELILRYPRLVWGICETSGSIQNASISFELRAGDNRVERFLLERDLACIKALCSEALSAELQLSSVQFSHPEPADVAHYERFFKCPVEFGQASSRLTFPLSELERKVPTADPLSREFYEAQCARMTADMDQPFRYTYLIRDHLARITPVPGLEALSAKLGIEPRTLQRLLKKEGQNFSQLLQEVRFKRACERLLYSNFTTAQIAEELGFNDAVAFSHAFKKWAGAAPRPWRQQYKPAAAE